MLLRRTTAPERTAVARPAVRRIVRGRRRVPPEPLRILLYHHDLNEAERFRFGLRERGVDVTIAVSLDEALERVARLRPVVVASARVAVAPGGYDCRFLRALRALAPERGGATPAVGLTPWAGDDVRDRILALGFQGHVGGPCTPEALAAELSRVAPGRAMVACATR